MRCSRCEIDYNPEAWDQCPHCGAELRIVAAGVMKTSTILISADSEESAGIYRSVEDVPEPLRKRLVDSTHGSNSGTIVIADQRGREEISKAIRNFPQQLRKSPREFAKANVPAIPPRSQQRHSSPFVFGALLAGFAGAVAWLVYFHPW